VFSSLALRAQTVKRLRISAGEHAHHRREGYGFEELRERSKIQMQISKIAKCRKRANEQSLTALG